MIRALRIRGTHLLRTVWLLFHTTIFAIRWATTLFYPRLRPKLLRLYCEYSGATFIKFGQLMAMRQDLLPQPYIDELSKLLDDVVQVPWEKIKSILLDQYGEAFYDHFKDIEREPLGCASIAQVHRGVLRNGDQVAIKIKRPRIERNFRIDLYNLKMLGRLLDRFTIGGSRGVSDFIGELARIMINELHFEREARHMMLMHDTFNEDDIDHYVPYVYPELTTPRVIVMECIKGVRVRDLVQAVKEKDEAALQRYAERGICPREVADTMFDSVFEQVFHHKVFHADPHAGNIIVMDGGTVAYIDFGIVAHMDDEMWRKQWELFLAVSREDVHSAYQAIVNVMTPLPPRTLIKVQVELKDRVWEWMVNARTGATSLRDKSSARLIFDCAQIGSRYNLHLPWRFLVSHRATLLSDSIVFTLDPKIDSLQKMRDFFKKEMHQQKLELMTGDQLVRTVSEGMEVLLTLPGFVNEVRRWMHQGVPEALREYSEGVTAMDTLVRHGLLYARRALFLTIAVVVFIHFSNVGLIDLPNTTAWLTGKGWWASVLALGVAMIFISRVLNDANRESA